MTPSTDETLEMKQLLMDFLAEFGMLNPSEMKMIADNTVLRKCSKGELLLSEGQRSKHCYAVLKGCVCAYRVVDGVSVTTAFYTEGDPVNAFTSQAENAPSAYYLKCLEDSVVTVGDEALIEEMCTRIPRLEAILRKEVERHSGLLQDQVAAFLAAGPEQRFMNLIADRPHLIARVPQHRIASYIGVTPESLSRIKRRVYGKMKS